MELNYIITGLILLLLTQMIARWYILLYLDTPAEFSSAPWYVTFTFNKSAVKIFHLKEAVLFHFIGLIGFCLCFITSTDDSSVFITAILIFIIFIFLYWKAVNWMDKKERWGSKKQNENIETKNIFKQIVKDGFLLSHAIILVLQLSFLGYTKVLELKDQDNKAVLKEPIEQIRQDRLQK